MALRFFTAGESHGKGIFAYLEGVPANFEVDFDFINEELSRRQKGYGRGKRMAIERDRIDFLSGVRLGKTLGTPIIMAIWNRDYENWKDIMKPERGVLPEDRKVTKPRPGHADLSGVLKRGFDDIRNVLERSSARETSGRVAAGALCKDILRRLGVNVGSYVLSIGTKSVDVEAIENLSFTERVRNANGSDVRIPLADESLEQLMKDEIDRAKELGESLGGTFQVFVSGLPAGIGDYTQWDKRLDGRLAQAVMSVQAVKGVEVGYGFRLAKLYGSKAHDEIFYDGGFYRKTNRAGGIEGGMSNGEPIVLTAAMKPIPTLYNPLMSVDIRTKKPFEASIERSDVCAVPAASVVAESMVSIVILDALLEVFPSMNFKILKENLDAYRDYLKR
jgi:chorismate synthase